MLLWSDPALLVVNKPAGLPVLPDGYQPDAPYLVSILKQAYQPLWVVHRLDRDTSGVMIFARSAEAHRSLNTQFEKRQASKLYHALVNGEPNWEAQTVDLPLRPDGDRRHRTVIDHQRGKPALTELHVLERFRRYALIEAAPQTGRTHQIRAHLAALGYPLVADALYGGGKGLYLSDLQPEDPASQPGASSSPILGRSGLHAWALAFQHPVRGERLSFQAPYPEDFGAALQQLRAFC